MSGPCSRALLIRGDARVVLWGCWGWEPLGLVRDEVQFLVFSSAIHGAEGGEKQLLKGLVQAVPVLFPAAPEMPLAGLFLHPDPRPLPWGEQALTLPFPSLPQAPFPWTPNLARAWRKAETSSGSFPRAPPSPPCFTLPSRSWTAHRSGAPEEGLGLDSRLAQQCHRQPVLVGKKRGCRSCLINHEALSVGDDGGRGAHSIGAAYGNPKREVMLHLRASEEPLRGFLCSRRGCAAWFSPSRRGSALPTRYSCSYPAHAPPSSATSSCPGTCGASSRSTSLAAVLLTMTERSSSGEHHLLGWLLPC